MYGLFTQHTLRPDNSGQDRHTPPQYPRNTGRYLIGVGRASSLNYSGLGELVYARQYSPNWTGKNPGIIIISACTVVPAIAAAAPPPVAGIGVDVFTFTATVYGTKKRNKKNHAAKGKANQNDGGTGVKDVSGGNSGAVLSRRRHTVSYSGVKVSESFRRRRRQTIDIQVFAGKKGTRLYRCDTVPAVVQLVGGTLSIRLSNYSKLAGYTVEHVKRGIFVALLGAGIWVAPYVTKQIVARKSVGAAIRAGVEYYSSKAGRDYLRDVVYKQLSASSFEYYHKLTPAGAAIAVNGINWGYCVGNPLSGGTAYLFDKRNGKNKGLPVVRLYHDRRKAGSYKIELSLASKHVTNRQRAGLNACKSVQAQVGYISELPRVRTLYGRLFDCM